MREGESRSCLQGHKVNLTSLQLIGMMSLAVKMTWESAQCLGRLFYGKNPQLSFLSVATTKCCIFGQTQANALFKNLSHTGSLPCPEVLFHNSLALSSLRAFNVTKACYLQVTVAKPVALEPHHYTRPSWSQRICVAQALENFHNVFEDQKMPHLPHPGFTYIWEVLILIPEYKTPASRIAAINTVLRARATYELYSTRKCFLCFF